MSDQIHDPEVMRLVEIANRLEHRYIDDINIWDGSPFEWIRGGLASRRKGVVFEELVSEWCVAKGLHVARSPDSDADRIIAGLRVEIKGSTLWKGGMYRFQQVRNQNYRILLCLGISPYDAHCWVIPKDDVMELWDEGKITSQHGGSGGSDTAWIAVNPTSPPDWIRPYGGTLSQGFAQIQSLIPQI